MSGQPAAKVLLGVSGSIAAYKAAELVRLFQKSGMEVAVMMTASSEKYIGALTFEALTGRTVARGGFGGSEAGVFQHIDLSTWADVVLVAPCTANVLAKIAHGIADDVVTSTVLASDRPLVLAPAMNCRMWNNPATRDNLATVKGRGVHVVDVASGELACGDEGPGRLADLPDILAAVQALLQRN